MNVITLVLIGLFIFLFGIVIGLLISRKTLNLSALGAVMLDKEEPENMYMVWNMELEDVLKKKIGLVQIKTFDSRNKQSL